MKHFLNSSLQRPILYLFLMAFSGVAFSADIMSLSDRKDRWEISFQTKYIESKQINFDGGSDATINEDYAFGFGVGYNFDEHWALDFDLNWGDVNYSGTRVLENGNKETVYGNLYSNSMVFTGIYNFMKKRFTPFVGVSAGLTYIDTNIPTGPPQTGCWYDPWWGYICDTFQPTLTSTEFTYGASAGFRFDVKDNVFLRFTAGKKWIDYSQASSSSGFTNFRFDVGLMF